MGGRACSGRRRRLTREGGADLSDNDLRGSGTIRLCQALVTSKNAVQELILDRNNMGCLELVYKATQWPSEAEMQKEGGALTRPFDILQPWPQVPGDSVPGRAPNLTSDVAVAQALAQMAIRKPLKSLSLQGNCLGDNAVAHLAQSLERAPALELTALNLSGNNASTGAQMRQFHKGAVALGALLAVNTSLSSLDLSSNGIRGPGAQAVAKGLRLNQAIASLSLAWNTFGDAKSLSHLRNWLLCANVAQLGASLPPQPAHVLPGPRLH
jgi:hypothetical protein